MVWVKQPAQTVAPIYKGASEKNIMARKALAKLHSFLDEKDAELVYFLQNLWGQQGRAITYQEIREALKAGDIDPTYLLDWQEDYAKLVDERLFPAWENAILTAAKEIEKSRPGWNFNPASDGVSLWLHNRTADFVTKVTQSQIRGLRAVIINAQELSDMNVDQLSRAIRPMVGLTHQQTTANLKYYTKLLNGGMNERKALDLSIRYSARQHRYRAYNIARTELAFAYNQGSFEGIKQGQENGYIGRVEKIWCTANNERVCEICGGLDGKAIEMEEDFAFNTRLATPKNPTIRRVPPAHPGCGCCVLYREVSPPNLQKGGIRSQWLV